jgi:hypothetical protein
MVILLFNWLTQTRAGSDKPPAKIRTSLSGNAGKVSLACPCLQAYSGENTRLYDNARTRANLRAWLAVALVTGLLRGYEWHVRSTRWWMNLIAPFARPMFIRNHGILMRQGAEGLARLLGAPLVGQESIDLMAEV